MTNGIGIERNLILERYREDYEMKYFILIMIAILTTGCVNTTEEKNDLHTKEYTVVAVGPCGFGARFCPVKVKGRKGHEIFIKYNAKETLEVGQVVYKECYYDKNRTQMCYDRVTTVPRQEYTHKEDWSF